MKFEEGNIYFSKIYVIQSLSEKERKTGTELHDDIISRRAWFDPNLSTELIDVFSRREILSVLERIKTETAKKENIPFIHFETHGTKNGLSLKSNENVLWDDILPIIREINVFSGNNLFISISACWGGNIQFQIKIHEKCPFRGFIGPIDEIYPSDLITSFTPFFDELLQNNDFDKAIKRLNLYNNSGVKFHHLNSEAFFDIVLEYHKEQCKKDPRIEEERIESIAKSYWKKDNRVRNHYKTKGRFKKFVKKFSEKETPKLYFGMRNNFLHIS